MNVTHAAAPGPPGDWRGPTLRSAEPVGYFIAIGEENVAPPRRRDEP
jgi:hypothetical protein